MLEQLKVQYSIANFRPATNSFFIDAWFTKGSLALVRVEATQILFFEHDIFEEAALCRRCLKIYLLLVDIAFLAAGMSSILVRDRLLDFVFCTLAAGCMLVAVVLYVAMPLPVALEECKHCPGARGLHSALAILSIGHNARLSPCMGRC